MQIRKSGVKILLLSIFLSVIGSFACYRYTNFGFMAGRIKCGIAPIDLGTNVTTLDRLTVIMYQTALWVGILQTIYFVILQLKKKH
jgi:hypothetical protein